MLRYALGLKALRKAMQVALLAGIALPATAQLNWRLELGVGPVFGRTDEMVDFRGRYEEKSSTTPDGMIGLGLQFPIKKQLNLGLETGIGLGIGEYFPKEVAKRGRDFESGYFQIPLRATYTLPLRGKNRMIFGLGAYWDLLFKKHEEMTEYDQGDRSMIGITPSVEYRHRALSLRLTYRNPIFHNGVHDLNRNRFMISIGINFGSSTWNHIGRGAMMLGEAIGSVPVSSNSYNTYPASGNSVAEDSTEPDTSSKGNKKKKQPKEKQRNAASEHANHKKLSLAYDGYVDLLIAMKIGNTPYNDRDRIHYQAEMKRIREENNAKYGLKITKAEIESWNGK